MVDLLPEDPYSALYPPENIFSVAGRGLHWDTAADVQEFCEEIAKYERLEVVRLSGNTLGIPAARAFAAALASQKHLKVLDLSDVFTGRLRHELPIALEAICKAVVDKESILELDLSDNAFGPAGAEPLAPFLVERRSLRTLRLNNNGLGPKGGQLVANALLEAAKRNQKENRESALRTVVIGRNRLENSSAEAFAEAFAAHGLLREVRMPQNGIRPEGIVTLLGGLAKCTMLRWLDLQDNTFTTTGAVALAKTLSAWTELEHLNVGDCMLNPEGGLAVANALLAFRPPLQKLNLSYGEIDERGALILSQAVALMPALRALELNGNQFAADGAAADAIRDALDRHNNGEALGSLSDMEELSEEEVEEEEEEEEKEEEEVDELAAALAKAAV
ncbi:hypothetical protein THASP1DRAFT_13718 [Thamnocephalis sphaerospora]|uniref:RNI-like protein n=1 Tax=Thamnocephalis sphaerospora TaxID=78915 RepID=A0A4V1IX50_9FUNG|nr:hypothetical protein THASP1DRAFT_13718 [Thamnocephalis sphaerospora]|eukprot:RKP09829.1 hypothetical protein THASP1DRAFT_13718 [Thamnocephalis sphaerospora]